MAQSTGYSVYLAYADECLRRRGMDGSSIFRAAGITDPGQIGVGLRLPEEILAHVVRRLNRHPRLEDFFLELGAAVPVTAHGNLGLAFMACDNAHQVLSLLARFAPIALPGVRAELHEEGADTLLRIHTSARYPEFSSAIAQALLVNVVVSLGRLVGRPIMPSAAALVQREPSCSDRFQEWIKAPICFNAESDSLTFRRSELEAKVLSADPVNLRLLLLQCEKELDEVQTRTGLMDRVRETLALNVAENHSIVWLAARLSMSERTLRRRLQEEGVGFRELLQTVRHDLAMHYLRDTDARIDRIADRLGYRDAACFRQTFSKKTGLSPRAWRQKRIGLPGSDTETGGAGVYAAGSDDPAD